MTLTKQKTNLLCLKVIVGCKVHGVGVGLLKKAIVRLLDHDKDIDYNQECGGSVISIKLDGKKPKVDKLSRISIRPCHDDDDELNDLSGSREMELPDTLADLSKYLEEDIVMEAEEEAECEARGAKMMNYKRRPLCIVACDLLLGLRRPREQPMDEIMIKRLLAGFEMCYNNDCDNLIEGKNTVDLRGLFVEEAIRKLVKNLNQCASSLVTPSEFLRVIVGCKVHGVGEGRLKQAVIDALTSQGIDFDKDDNDFTILIEVDGSKNYSSLEGVLDELNYSDGDLDSVRSWSDKSMGAGATPGDSKEMVPKLMKSVANHGRLKSRVEDAEGFLYTIVCDLLFDFAMPRYQSQDEKISEMVLADHEKCDGDDSNKITEGNPRVYLRSRTIDELINLLALHLDGWSRSPGCKKFIAGCKLHGIREKKLKQGITDLTKPWKRIVEEKRLGSIFYIIFDGRKDCIPKEMVPMKALETTTVDNSAGKEFTMEVKGNSAELAEGKVHLCTALCDLIFSLPKLLRHASVKILTALEQCYKNDRYEDEEGILFIDLRGRNAEGAVSVLTTALALPHSPQYLNIIVGCKVHGVGDGKLKMTICGLLKLDEDIDWIDNWKGLNSVISVKLDGKRFPLLWEIRERFSSSILRSISYNYATKEVLSFVASRTSGGGEDDVTSEFGSSATDDDEDVGPVTIDRKMDASDAIISEYKSRSLCTVACDFLHGLRMPRDEDIRKRVLTGLQICYQDYRGNCVESTNTVDLRGWFVVEAIEELIKHLNLARGTALGILQVLVGCKIHGVGQGKLKQAIIALLDSDKDIEYNQDVDFMITIKLDDQKDYATLRKVSCILAHSDDDFDSLCSESDTDDDFGTFDCKLLFGHSTKSDQWQDEEMSGKVKLCGSSVGEWHVDGH